MKSPVRSRILKNLDLERDLLLTEKDLRYMKKVSFEKKDRVELSVYLDFLEVIGAFNTKRTQIEIYPCDFEL